MLKHLREHKQEIYSRIDKLSRELVEGVPRRRKMRGGAMLQRVGSMFTGFFTAGR